MDDLDIRELGEGEQVSEDGVYAIPLERYHSQNLCIAPSVSSSMLRKFFPTLWGGAPVNPAAFWAFSELNPDAPPREEKAAFGLGSALHDLLIEPDVFRKLYVGDLLIEDFHEDFLMRTADDMKAWLREHGLPLKGTKADLIERLQESSCPNPIWDVEREKFLEENKDRVILSKQQVTDLEGMAKSLTENPKVKACGIFEGHRELSFIYRHETGVFVKSRMDVQPKAGFQLDLKTTRHEMRADGTIDHLAKRNWDMRDRKYFMQNALGATATRRVAGWDAAGAGIVYVGSVYPYSVTFHNVSLNLLSVGELLNEKAIHAFANGMKCGEWPAPTDEAEATLPEKIIEEIAA